MKKIVFCLVAAISFFLVGCLETTQEVTLNEDGSGTISTINDFSAAITMGKQMGGSADMEKEKPMDTTFSLQRGADSLLTLSADERALVRKGTMSVKVNYKDEKAFTSISFPFSKPSEIEAITKLSGKVLGDAMKEQMKEQMKDAPQMGAGDIEASSMDDYYNLEYSNGELTRKVNKSKYAGVESDQILTGLKQLTGMGVTVKSTYIINLPRPATKAEGKNVKLSADRKKVTVTAELDDFFQDASVLEFKVKY